MNGAEMTDEQARELAARWACTETPGGCGSQVPECMGALDTYELGALLGWVAREMEREEWALLREPDEPEARRELAAWLATRFGWEHDGSDEDTLAWALCEAAGWPS